MQEIDVQHYVLPALLALLVFGSFLVIVTSGGGDEPAGAVDRPLPSTSTATTRTTATSTTSTTAASSSARFDKVRPGDTPTSIADRAGITTERLLELNPSIDPKALRPGQTLKLAP